MIERPRRLRRSASLRDLVAETRPNASRLIMPWFVCEGKGVREEIRAMPGIERVSADELLKNVEVDLKAGLRQIILFGVPSVKDSQGSGAWNPEGVVQKTVRALKKRFPELLVITDVCLCEYTDHGHCGLIHEGDVDNDSTLELLARSALSHAEAGADIVAPSDMMDGRVTAIRSRLDESGFTGIPIISYAAKYASAFYGPFREAAGSAPSFGDRRTYQMDVRNGRESEREILIDIREGADIIMVKPGLAFLDIVRRARDVTDLPLCVYNVSGEYSMVKEAARAGLADEPRMVTEIMTAFFRAGADMVISYHTREIIHNRWFS